MRIGLLTDGYKPGINGVIRFIALHQRTLREMGHEVYVFTWGRPDPGDEEGVIRSPGIPFFVHGYWLSSGYSRPAQAVLKGLDILHANQPALSGAVALRYGKRYNLPIALTCHSRYDLLGKIRLPLMPLRLYRASIRPYMHWLTNQCDLVMAPTMEAAQVMEGLGVVRPITVVPNGIDAACYRKPQGALARGDLGLPESVPLTISVGRLEAGKNVQFLLQALARPELAHRYLLIVGGGPEQDELQALANALGLNGRARFVGWVPPNDVPAYLALADLFVTASGAEMLSTAVVEALAAGLPVVGPNLPWIRPAVHHGVSGILAELEMPAFAQAWAALADEKHLRERLARGAKAAGEQYDVRHTTAQMVRLYEQAIERHRRGRDE